MDALPTFAVIFFVAVLLMGLVWFLRDSFTSTSYERQTAGGHFSDQFTTVDDLPERTRVDQIMVKCRKCGVSYSAGITGDFEPQRLGNVTTTCPFCNQRNVTSPRSLTYSVS